MNICYMTLVAMLIEALFFSFGSSSFAVDSSFVQTAKLMASDVPNNVASDVAAKAKASEDQFGTSIAASGDTLLIGAPGDDGDAGAVTSAGAAYVFVKDPSDPSGEKWTQAQKLTASDGAAGNLFGGSVAILGDTALISARGNDNLSGAVYVFVRNTDGTWNPTETQKLTASDGAAGRLFGFSLALTENLAVIGARGNGTDEFAGAAYTFVFTPDQNGPGQWQEKQKLIPASACTSDATIDTHAQEFGCSVATSSNTILVGVCGDDEHGVRSGAVYVFTLNNERNCQALQKLAASDSSGGEEFGYSVAINDTVAVVGARFADGAERENHSGDHSGAVYLFAPGDSSSGGLWSETQKLFASDGVTSDAFGSSVAIAANRIVVGALGDDEKGSSAGAVYFFALDQSAGSTATWHELQKITGRDEVTEDQFGQSFALTENFLIVGSPFDDITVINTDSTTTTFTNAGSVYVLSLSSLPGVCESKTDYTTDSCSGTFTVTSLTDLQQYFDDNYGLKDNNNKYKNLKITASLGDRQDTPLFITSPCTITLQGGVRLAGDFVSVDGRKGVVGDHSYELDAKKACLLSTQDRAGLGNGAIVNAGALTIRAAKAASIGKDATIDVDGDLDIESTGDTDSSQALLDSGTVVTAGSLRIGALRQATLGGSTTVAVDGAIFLVSTGTGSKSKAGVGDGAKVQATDLTISAPREARVGKNAAIRLSGQLKVEATGSDSTAIITKGAQISVGENAEILGGGSAVLDKNTVLTVTEDFHMQAIAPEKCQIKKGVTIAAGSMSGNCFAP